MIALPRAVARGVGGLAADERGFIRTDEHGRVESAPGVWAAGDAIAFPIKQGGLAAQQADAAAEAIAAEAGADIDAAAVPPRPPRRPAHRPRQALDPPRPRRDRDEGETQRHALWWPPTKIAGRYLAPYLAALDEAEFTDADRPTGQLVEFTVEGHGR